MTFRCVISIIVGPTGSDDGITHPPDVVIRSPRPTLASIVVISPPTCALATAIPSPRRASREGAVDVPPYQRRLARGGATEDDALQSHLLPAMMMVTTTTTTMMVFHVIPCQRLLLLPPGSTSTSTYTYKRWTRVLLRGCMHRWEGGGRGEILVYTASMFFWRLSSDGRSIFSREEIQNASLSDRFFFSS